MNRHSDIVIVGAGIIGMLSARELARGGARVTLVERSDWGQESSWAGGGILSPLYPWRYTKAVNNLARWSQEVYPQLIADLHAATGIDAQWTDCGLLVLETREQTAAAAWASDYPLPWQPVGTADADRFRLAPAPLAAGGLWFPSLAHVRNPRLLQALHQELLQLGVQFRLQTAVTGFHRQGDRIEHVDTPQGPLAGDHFLICAGAWSGLLAEQLALALPVAPVKGQMILLAANPGVVPCMVLRDGRYLIPRRDGHLLVGSTLENTGFAKETSAAARRELFDFALGLYPELASFPVVRHWAGLRPGTAQGIPLIGRHPAYRNAYFNTGHFRNGVVLAPASSRLIRNIILNEPPILDPSPYLP